MKLPRLFALAWLLSFCSPVPAAVLSNVPVSSLTTTNKANTNDFLLLVNASGENRKLPVGWVLNGTNLVPGTVNSNALDAASLAALAGGGTVDTSTIQPGSAVLTNVSTFLAPKAVTVTLTNSYNLNTWHGWGTASNAPAVVLTVGDSMAEAVNSVGAFVQKRLVKEYGLGGAAQFNGTYNNFFLGVPSNGCSYASRTLCPSNVWPWSLYILPPNASLYFTNSQQSRGMAGARLGVAYLKHTNGGNFGIMASSIQQAFTNVMTINASNPATATAVTNWTTPGNDAWRLAITNGSTSTNYILGAWSIDPSQRSIVPMAWTEGGVALSNITAAGSANLNPVWFALRPQLAIWHFRELGLAGSNALPTFAEGLTNLATIVSAWTNCEHVWLLPPWPATTNVAAMAIPAEHAYALDILGRSGQWHFCDLATDYNPTNQMAQGWYDADSAGIHIWHNGALSTMAGKVLRDLGLTDPNADHCQFGNAVTIGRNNLSGAVKYGSLNIGAVADTIDGTDIWPNGQISMGPLGSTYSGIVLTGAKLAYTNSALYGTVGDTRVGVAANGTGRLTVNNTEPALMWSSWGVTIGGNAHPTGRLTMTNYTAANLGHHWRAGADGNLVLSNSYSASVLSASTNGTVTIPKLSVSTTLTVTTNSAPGDTATPKLWVDVTVGGSVYKMPLYQ